ncbi:type II toxin-antitoxin system Phd/YefM family antitoxin [Mycobacterium sp. 050134]|uniref:type II toxin-antitoxin system Phd/YefM family antitoxin n=1 Tax=Mycobacterium sp. 050134 TaxID=3096111 RepID=UPI002EDA2E05
MPEAIGLGQLRSHACAYLERVATGETLDVVRRGKLVARIVPVGAWRVAPVPARTVKAAADPGSWVGLDELRTRAGRCFDRVAAGETIYVVRGGRFLAKIVSAGDSRTAPSPADTGERIELDELRKRAGRYFDTVAAGQTIEVTRGGELVARIVSAAVAEANPAAPLLKQAVGQQQSPRRHRRGAARCAAAVAVTVPPPIE